MDNKINNLLNEELNNKNIPDLPDLSSIQNNNNKLEDINSNEKIKPIKKINQARSDEPKPSLQSIEPINILVDTHNEIIEKRTLILTIQRYILEFEKHLPNELHSTDYRNFNVTELQMLLNEIRFTIAVRNCGKMGDRAFKQTLIHAILYFWANFIKLFLFVKLISGLLIILSVIMRLKTGGLLLSDGSPIPQTAFLSP